MPMEEIPPDSDSGRISTIREMLHPMRFDGIPHLDPRVVSIWWYSGVLTWIPQKPVLTGGEVDSIDPLQQWARIVPDGSQWVYPRPLQLGMTLSPTSQRVPEAPGLQHGQALHEDHPEQ